MRIRIDTVSENCIFHISRRFEFSHNQSHIAVRLQCDGKQVRPCASSTFDTKPEGSVAPPESATASAAIARLGINASNRSECNSVHGRVQDVRIWPTSSVAGIRPAGKLSGGEPPNPDKSSGLSAIKGRPTVGSGAS